MNFNIYVSQHGRFLFSATLQAVSQRSLVSAISIAQDMRKRYPEVDGFKVSLTQLERVSKDASFYRETNI